MYRLGIPELMILAILAIFFIPAWKIVAKTGYSGALSLLIVVPLVNVGLILFLAFSDWPIHKRLKELEGQNPSAPNH